MKVKIRDCISHQGWGTFGNYMMDYSKNGYYGKLGHTIVKPNFVDDLYPSFVIQLLLRTLKGKMDENDEVHFVPFVDKYLLEVLENV